MIAINRTREKVLAGRVGRAKSFLARLRGLLGKGMLPAGEGLWISPCRCVHSIGMRYAIDILFVDAQGKVIGLCHGFPPNRVTRYFRAASGALELPSGVISGTETALYDLLEFREEGMP